MRALMAISLSFVGMTLMAHVPLEAQVPGTSQDEWGLTERDWMTKTPPELRQAIGMPGVAPRVVAAAEKGDVKAAAILAGAYSVGAGVPKDDAEGLRWARLAAERNLPVGHFALALKYQQGSGVAASQTDYQRHLKLAADAGYAPALLQYGLSLIETPDGKEGPDPLSGRDYIERAAELGQANAVEVAEIWSLNDAFVEAGDGMPLWKDGRGLLRGHGDLFAFHPCRTDVRGRQGGRWTIDWSQTRAYGGAKGTIEFEGVIWVHDVDMSSKVFGFFEFEGASRNLERSRANFAQMKESADALYARCSALARR